MVKFEVAKGKPMAYPYTFGAAMMQFPFRWHWANERVFRMVGYSLAITLPVFYLIQKATCSEGNRKTWADIRAKRERKLNFSGFFQP